MTPNTCDLYEASLHPLTISGPESYTDVGQGDMTLSLPSLNLGTTPGIIGSDIVLARMAESVDAVDSKSTDRMVVRVRVSLWAPKSKKSLLFISFY